jgi:hypothetical protein
MEVAVEVGLGRPAQLVRLEALEALVLLDRQVQQVQLE